MKQPSITQGPSFEATREGGAVPAEKVVNVSSWVQRVMECTGKRRTSIIPKGQVMHMLSWAALFLVIAIVAAIFGFGGIVSAAASIAKVLFFIFLILFLISLFTGRRGSA